LSPWPNFAKTGLAPAGFVGKDARGFWVLVKTGMAIRDFGIIFGILGAASLALAGCVSSPTYGTGKTSAAQLGEDVSNLVSIGPKPKAKIDYAPRPELVRPAAGAALPAPQDSAKTLAAANWPESPEQRRIRLKAAATAAQNDPLFVPTIKNDGFGVQTAALTPAEQQASFRAARKANSAGSPTTRAFLSEPPLEYRAPADSAAVGETGEDELKKEKRLKREAQKKGGGKSWRDFVPWL
jgi:hypothetical protein